MSNGRYIFRFDGTNVNEPSNWNKLITTIRRDDASRGLLVTQDAQLIFTGPEYTYLYDKLRNDGFCGYTDLEILESCLMDGNYESVYTGVIFTSDCEFELDRCTATTKVQDNSFYAKINGRKSNDAYINVGRSINDIAIDACVPITITLFYPCSPASEADRYGYRMLDVMEFLVAFMTDGEVGFRSPVLDDGGDFEGLCIASGKQLRVFGEQDHISKFSFVKALDNLYKKLNVSFYIDYTGVKPVLVLDYDSNMYDNTTLLSLTDVPGIKAKVDVNKIYSAVTLGTSETLEYDLQCDGSGDYTTGAFIEQIDFLGCKNETYNVIGKCNIDKTLNLSSDWVVSSNVIQYVYIDADGEGDESYDDKIFFIDCDKTGDTTYEAKKDNNLGEDVTVRAFYNVRLFNYNVAERFLGAIPLSIAEYLGTVDDLFYAKRNSITDNPAITPLSPLASNEPVQFDDDYTAPYHDVNNHYGNATVQGNPVSQANSRFTAFASGMYVFKVVIGSVVCGIANANLTVAVKRYDAGNAYISFSNLIIPMQVGASTNVEFELPSIYMNATDYVQVDIGYGTAIGIDDLNFGLTFECISNPGGGIYKTYDPADYPIVVYSFQYPISNSDKKLLKQYPYRKIAFTYNGSVYYAWVSEVKVNDTTGLTDFKLISNTRVNAGN